MKTSARNHFTGTIRAIRSGAVNDEIELDIAGGQHIVATITTESTAALGLKIGGQAHALVKAASVILMTEPGNFKFSARNQLTGTISRLTKGAVNSDVTIELPGSGVAAAVVTNESAAAMGLATGTKVTAMFKVSNVVLAAER